MNDVLWFPCFPMKFISKTKMSTQLKRCYANFLKSSGVEDKVAAHKRNSLEL